MGHAVAVRTDCTVDEVRRPGETGEGCGESAAVLDRNGQDGLADAAGLGDPVQ
jgi:hypothetical protein